MSRRAFVLGGTAVIAATLLPAELLAAPAVAASTTGRVRATLDALLALVAASPELAQSRRDLGAARDRLMRSYAAAPADASAAILVDALDGATRSTSFASASREEQIRALRRVLAEQPTRIRSGPLPPREHVVAGLQRTATALRQLPHRPPMPSLTVADGVVIS
jgi:hypothetical protein